MDIQTLSGPGYTEASYTPIISGATLAGAGTYTQQLGYYSRVGNKVTAIIYLTTTAHTGTGQIKISLPFTPRATYYGGICICNVGTSPTVAASIIQGYVGPSDSVLLSCYPPATGIPVAQNIAAVMAFIITVTYQV